MTEPALPSPALLFTASTVLIGMAFFLIAPSWRSIRKALDGLTPAKRKSAFKVRKVKDKKRKDRALALNFLLLGCYCLGVSITFNLLALTGIAATMLELHLGPWQAENYNWGIWCVFIGIAFWVIGIICIGYVRIWEATRFKLGESSLLDD